MEVCSPGEDTPCRSRKLSKKIIVDIFHPLENRLFIHVHNNIQYVYQGHTLVTFKHMNVKIVFLWPPFFLVENRTNLVSEIYEESNFQSRQYIIRRKTLLQYPSMFLILKVELDRYIDSYIDGLTAR